MTPKRKLGLTLLIILTGILYWNYTSQFIEPSRQEFIVERIVDGDTIVLNNSEKVRLLGINTPEKEMLFSNEAGDFLKDQILNQTILLERTEGDRYGRVLGYVFNNNQNINELILENGLANLYYYGEDKYYSDMEAAEKQARKNDKGIWQRSKNYGCLEIIEWTWLDESDSDSEKLILKNNCDVKLSLLAKDDATHIYEKALGAREIWTLETKDIWNDKGDSLYIWDEEGLVEFKRY